jgi:hypothetical protein
VFRACKFLPAGIVFALSLALIAVAATVHGGSKPSTPTIVYRLDSTDGLELINTTAQVVNYRGRRALHLAPGQAQRNGSYGRNGRGSMIALVADTNFKNGTIEVDVAGVPIPSMDPDARGFVGVVFRSQPHGEKAENIYLRPTNGRSGDQLRRNHSVQYESLPDFPWERLRKEQPGVYESYTDLDPGAWTKMKIAVDGLEAKLYVNGAQQPCLIVNDLKLGDSRGQVGLWAFVATDAYFSNLAVTSEP